MVSTLFRIVARVDATESPKVGQKYTDRQTDGQMHRNLQTQVTHANAGGAKSGTYFPFFEGGIKSASFPFLFTIFLLLGASSCKSSRN